MHRDFQWYEVESGVNVSSKNRNFDNSSSNLHQHCFTASISPSIRTNAGRLIMATTTNRKILILGSGMVAPPCIEYLSRRPENQITVGEVLRSLTFDRLIERKQHVERYHQPRSLCQPFLVLLPLLWTSPDKQISNSTSRPTM